MGVGLGGAADYCSRGVPGGRLPLGLSHSATMHAKMHAILL
jgi:hypothetical protein